MHLKYTNKFTLYQDTHVANRISNDVITYFISKLSAKEDQLFFHVIANHI